MTYVDAQKAFNNRLFKWGERSLKYECGNQFRSLRFMGRREEKARTVLMKLSISDTERLCRALLTRAHPVAAASIYGELDEESKAHFQRFENQISEPVHGAFVSMGMKATRKRLKTLIKKMFKERFPGQKREIGSEAEGLSYLWLSRGWTIVTSFNFGRWEAEVDFSHTVWTGKTVSRAEPGKFNGYNNLGMRINYCANMGFFGGWKDIDDASAEEACGEVLVHCERFFSECDVMLEEMDINALLD